jgi:hypothetical protein
VGAVVDHVFFNCVVEIGERLPELVNDGGMGESGVAPGLGSFDGDL